MHGYDIFDKCLSFSSVIGAVDFGLVSLDAAGFDFDISKYNFIFPGSIFSLFDISKYNFILLESILSL